MKSERRPRLKAHILLPQNVEPRVNNGPSNSYREFTDACVIIGKSPTAVGEGNGRLAFNDRFYRWSVGILDVNGIQSNLITSTCSRVTELLATARGITGHT